MAWAFVGLEQDEQVEVEMPAVAVETEKAIAGRRRLWRLGLLVVVAVGLIWGGWRWWNLAQYRRALAEVQKEIQAGRHGHAKLKLREVSAWNTGSDEVAYLLGICERAQGRPDAAVELWAKVAPSSSFAVPAILRRAELLVERGRLADAEQLINTSLEDPRIDGSGLRLSLLPAYCFEGRVNDAERMIEANWNHLRQSGAGGSDDAIKLLRLHITLRLEEPTVEATRAFLDQAARSAPDDDRVSLGRANLAIRTGAYDEASRWIESCIRRRPDDAPVWRASLKWAMATDDIATIGRALEHLRVCDFPVAQYRTLAAWLAARGARIDRDFRGLLLEKELNELRLALVADPADVATLDRLAARAVQEGRLEQAPELRRKKTEIGELRARYRELYNRNQPYRDAAEMARLAMRLSHWFEAKAFLTIAIAVEPKRDDLRGELDMLGKRRENIDDSTTPLATLLGPDLNRAGLKRP
jgi:enediyne biosynthesis protein E4